MKLSRRFVLTSAAALATPALAQDAWGIRKQPSFREVIERVVAMPNDADLQARAGRLGLGVMNVMWEDTGRFEGSSVGPTSATSRCRFVSGWAIKCARHCCPSIPFTTRALT